MSNRILFVPVSSPQGVGEYMRSLTLAQSLASQCADMGIHFILSEQTAYHASCPFPVTLCPTSPTQHSDRVRQCIAEFQPNIVVFDASGRVAQLRAAKESGAHTVFIAQHSRKLNKGLSWRRLRFTDAIFVVQPQQFMPKISIWQKAKLRLLRKKLPRYVGPLIAECTNTDHDQLLERYELTTQPYILLSAGGGTHQVDGALASELFLQAAHEISSRTGHHCFVVLGANYVSKQSQHEKTAQVTVIDVLPPKEFIGLLQSARLAMLSGGASLLQAMHLDTPTICIPLAKDQFERVSQCGTYFNITVSKPLLPELVRHAQEQLETHNRPQTPHSPLSHIGKNGLNAIRDHLVNTLNQTG